MLKSYFQIAVRHLLKNKVFTLVSLLGLAIGMAGALLICEYTTFERSFDTFHANYKNVYRVTSAWNRENTGGVVRATTVPWSGAGLRDQFPEITAYTRLAPITTFTGETWAGFEERKIDGRKIFFVDPGFLDVFSFPLLKGDAAEALRDPFSVIITESLAQKLFGDHDPLGKTLTIDTHSNLGPDGWGADNNFKITGVARDVPANSHFTFDILISYTTLYHGIRESAYWNFAYCYLLLHPATDVPALEKKIVAYQEKKLGKGIYDEQGTLQLQPLADIHLFSTLKDELQLNGDGRSLNFLALIGICILLSAYVNYINLSTAKSAERKREIGIRKVVGSSKGQLVAQLLTESFLLNLAASFVAIVIARLSVPLLEQIFNMSWPPRAGWISFQMLAISAGIVVAGTVFSVVYPAFILTSFKPVNVLKVSASSIGQRHGKLSLGKILMGVQFTFCIVLLISTYALYRQLQYMKEYDLGMDINRVLIVKDYGFQPYRICENFKAGLSSLPFVHSTGASSAPPGEEVTLHGLRHNFIDKNGSVRGELKMVSADNGFFKTLGIQLLAGKTFEGSDSTDAIKVVVNEAAARLMGYETPSEAVGEIIPKFHTDHDLEIIGVIKNYNQLSLQKAYEPTLYAPNWFWDDYLGWNKRFVFIRLEDMPTENMPQAIAQIGQVWKGVAPEHPFQYFFLDNFFDQQYRTDNITSALFLFFSVYSIFVSCLGLFGLVAYSVLQRTREIGIRKVFGATVANILVLVSKDYMGVITLSAIVSLPLTAWALQHWLNHYAFRIDQDVWLYLFPLFLVFAISLLTILFKSISAAATSPAKSLRE